MPEPQKHTEVNHKLNYVDSDLPAGSLGEPLIVYDESHWYPMKCSMFMENAIDELVLPHRLTELGKSMRPVWVKTSGEIDAPSIRFTVPIDIATIAWRYTDAIQRAIGQISNQVNGLMTDIVSNESASDDDIHRAVGRLEARLDDLLANYKEILCLNTVGSNEEARMLLEGAYQHVIVEIGNWLKDVVDTLADPTAAARKRGISTTGNVELRLTLTLTAPPQCCELMLWVERRREQSSETVRVPKSSGLGFWGVVGLATFIYGIVWIISKY